MTVTLHDRSTGDDYRGATAESVARRVWGRRAQVEYAGRVGGALIADITVPVAGAAVPRPRRILAQVTVYDDGPGAG